MSKQKSNTKHNLDKENIKNMVKSLINKEEKPMNTEKMAEFMHEKSEFSQLMANFNNVLQNNDLTNEQKVEEIRKMIKTNEDIKENHVLINN